METSRYKKKLNCIKNYAADNYIPEKQINEVFKECFELLEAKKSTKLRNLLKFFKIFCLVLLLIIFSLILSYNHPKTHHVFLRNLQNYIYPGLRIFRKLAIPIVTVYPSVTEWYNEWCLVQNPYFQVNEMDCWPCSSINSVQNLTDYNSTYTFNVGIPFIRNEKKEKVAVNEIIQIYREFNNIPRADDKLSTFDEILSSESNQIRWRINHMESNRKIRQLFPKLPGTPDWWSPSTEKFIFIDGPKAAKYELPNPECANAVIQCVTGERLIELNPSPECTKKCKKLQILLSDHQSLWYNWWYWRPKSFPTDNSTLNTIMHMTSYC